MSKSGKAFFTAHEMNGFEEDQDGQAVITEVKKHPEPQDKNVMGVRSHLGTFESPELAHIAYLRAKENMHNFQPNLANRSDATY